MAFDGRIIGRVNGGNYELVQYGQVVQTMTIDAARADKRFRKTIQRNRWEEI